MTAEPKPNRKSIRLKNYNYAKNGYYFITICTKNHKPFFGNINNDEMQLNQLGKITHDIWKKLPEKYPNIKLNSFVIMPNHIHAIIIIEKDINQQLDKITLGKIIGGYKSIVFNKCLKFCKEKNIKMERLWQRNYYEHIIRNEEDLLNIQEYIQNNPLKWANDDYNLKE